MNRPQKNLLGGLLAVGLCLMAGCVTQTKTAKVHYFFPQPPDEPRLQYLTSFSSQKELRGKDDATFMNYLTGTRPVQKGFAKPYGAVAAGGKLYVCDTDLNAVIVTDLQTGRMHILEAQGEGALQLPLNMAVDAQGNAYVADSQRDQVIIFDKDENFVSAIGKQGEMKPRDVAVDQKRIYIADFIKRSVRVFDKATRAPLFDIPSGSDATNPAAILRMPTNIALDKDGRVYVGDTGAFHVQVYDLNGKYLRTVGEFGDGMGQFARVKGVAVDRENRLYAVDAMSQVVQLFDEKGRLLTWFGDPTMGKETPTLPAKVAVDYDDAASFQRYAAPNFKIEYLVFVINQLGPHKVNVYGFGHKN